MKPHHVDARIIPGAVAPFQPIPAPEARKGAPEQQSGKTVSPELAPKGPITSARVEPEFGTINGDTVLVEFHRLRELVSTLEPDFEVGGLLKGKKFGNVELLWNISDERGDHEIIRIYREAENPGEKHFDVSFHRGTHLIDGHNVVRRFVGYPLHWRADTLDIESGEYLQRQGGRSLLLNPGDWEVLKTWDIGQPVER